MSQTHKQNKLTIEWDLFKENDEKTLTGVTSDVWPHWSNSASHIQSFFVLHKADDKLYRVTKLKMFQYNAITYCLWELDTVTVEYEKNKNDNRS